MTAHAERQTSAPPAEIPVACVIVVSRPANAPLLCEVWPTFAVELAAALEAEGEDRLADQVGQLRVVASCGCATVARTPHPRRGSRRHRVRRSAVSITVVLTDANAGSS
jgi:hypothetical protein